ASWCRRARPGCTARPSISTAERSECCDSVVVPAKEVVKQWLSAVVPAKAGTHTPQQGDVEGPAVIETLVVMGPRFRGDDTEQVSRHEYPSYTRAHWFGGDQESHRHAVDDDAHGRCRGHRHRCKPRLLRGGPAARHAREPRRGRRPRGAPPAIGGAASLFPFPVFALPSPASPPRSIATAPRHRSSSGTAAGTRAPTSAARRRSRHPRSRIQS